MLITWQREFDTGVERVDQQHRRLVEIINGLYHNIGAGQGEAAILGVLGELTRYAEHHFATEERLLSLLGPASRGTAVHIAAHETYRQRIGDIRARHEAGENLVAIQVLAFVSEWWVGHIAECDRGLRVFAPSASEAESAPLADQR